jgi:DNA-nicking Smr family endonuclease
VLRDALPEWLAEEPHGERVLAFASADEHGGGASYVLLRRAR